MLTGPEIVAPKQVFYVSIRISTFAFLKIVFECLILDCVQCFFRHIAISFNFLTNPASR